MSPQSFIVSHIPALQTTPHGRALSPFQIFQRNVNPNAKNVRARLVVFNNQEFTVLSQGVILGDETNQCVFLTLAAALGIDADDFRQDVRHGALAFRASQEKVLDEPQTTCIAELNKPSKMVDLEFLTLFHVKVLADTNIVVLSGSETLTCDIFQHPKKAEESASSSRKNLSLTQFCCISDTSTSTTFRCLWSTRQPRN